MKKLLSMMLAFALVMSMSVTAFAAEDKDNKPGDSQDIEVTAKYTTVSETTVYSVDIEWEEMTFTYAETGSKTWNPSDHSYTDTTSGGWNKTSATVKVTNHSNAAVNVEMEYVASTTDTGITGTLSNGSKTELAAGVEGKYDEAASVTATLTISGTPNSNVAAAGTTIGTITVKIS